MCLLMVHEVLLLNIKDALPLFKWSKGYDESNSEFKNILL